MRVTTSLSQPKRRGNTGCNEKYSYRHVLQEGKGWNINGQNKRDSCQTESGQRGCRSAFDRDVRRCTVLGGKWPWLPPKFSRWPSHTLLSVPFAPRSVTVIDRTSPGPILESNGQDRCYGTPTPIQGEATPDAVPKQIHSQSR